MSDYRFHERFLGLPDVYSQRDTSAVWMLSVPLDMTTSYLSGTREGPTAIVGASIEVEPFDDEFDGDAIYEYGVHMLPSLHPPLDTAKGAVDHITQAVNDLLPELGDRLLVTLGGEHTITVGLVAAFAAKHPDLVVVQIDAHTDLRDEFDGTRYSHACTARRCLDYAPVLQLGIRSFGPDDVKFVRQTDRVRMWTGEAIYRDRERRYLSELREAIAGRPVYLTIDLDGLDPSYMPAVGTPEPGGILWYDCLDLVKTIVQSGNVVAFDCVELCPIPGGHGSAFAAARLIYKTLNYVMETRGKLARPAVK